MGCTSFCLADCIKANAAKESPAAGLYFCRRACLCESKLFKDGSFNIRCAQSPFYHSKPPSEKPRQ